MFICTDHLSFYKLEIPKHKLKCFAKYVLLNKVTRVINVASYFKRKQGPGSKNMHVMTLTHLRFINSLFYINFILCHKYVNETHKFIMTECSYSV